MALKLGQVIVTSLALKHGFVLMTGPDAPVSGETGANVAGPGSLYAHCAEGDGALYINVGSRSDPQWKQLMTTE